MKICLDGRKMTDKEALHTYLAEMLALPAYYGRNLDALHDSLTEMGEVEIEVAHQEEMLAALGKYGESLLRLFADIEKETK